MSQYRTPTAYVLGVLVLLAAVVLTTPAGGTHARWSATAHAQVPAMTTGRVGFEVGRAGGAESSATLTNTSGFAVRYRPQQVTLLDAGGRSVAPPQGMGFAYRTGEACEDATAPARWSAVAPGGSAAVAVDDGARAPLERDRPTGLCLSVSTAAVHQDALRPLDGQVLQVVTQLEATALGGGAWSATRSWAVPFTVVLPAVEQPTVPAPVRPVAQHAAQCGADHSAALLRWTWTGDPGAPAVTEWQVRVRPVGSTGATTLLKTVPGAAAGEVRITATDLLGTEHLSSQDYEVLVRAVLAGGGTQHVDSVYAWTVKTPGRSGNVNCAGIPS